MQLDILAIALSLVTIARSAAVPPTGADPTPTTGSEYLPAGKGNWTLQGCYEDFYPNGRAMNGAYTEAHPGKKGMTIATCLDFCESNGQNFAGLEAGYQCYCAPGRLDGGSKQTQNPNGLTKSRNGGCRTACTGNASQNCGGDNRILLFASNTVPPADNIDYSENFKYLGCYKDDENNRLFKTLERTSSNNTLESCFQLGDKHRKPGFLFGVENRNECWTSGAGLLDSARFKKAATDESNCERTCTGKFSEICGGSGFLSVYETPTRSS